jgi:hypothetical protein
MTDPATALAAVFDARKPDGTFVYSDEEVRHYLPLLILTAKIPFQKLDAAAQRILGEFVGAAQLDLSKPPAEVQAVIEKHYEKNPVNPALHKGIMDVVRSVLAGGGDVSSAALAALGGQKTTGVLGGGVRPAGTAPGGVLARLASIPPKKP